MQLVTGKKIIKVLRSQFQSPCGEFGNAAPLVFNFTGSMGVLVSVPLRGIW